MHKKLHTILQAEIDPAFAKRSQLILEAIDQKQPTTILDAGCGRGFYVHAFTYFNSLKEICGIDVMDKYLTVAKKHITDKRVHLQNASIYKLPYPDNHFDVVVSSEVMEHLEDDVKALKELKRVLKKDGIILITVPNKNFPFLWDPLNWILMKFFNTHIPKDIWWLAGIWADHERLYTEKGLRRLVEKAELKTEQLQHIVRVCWPFSHFLLYGIGKNIVERLGAKDFDRFNFKDKPLSRVLAWFMRLPTYLPHLKKDVSMGMFVKVTK